MLFSRMQHCIEPERVSKTYSPLFQIQVAMQPQRHSADKIDCTCLSKSSTYTSFTIPILKFLNQTNDWEKWGNQNKSLSLNDSLQIMFWSAKQKFYLTSIILRVQILDGTNYQVSTYTFSLEIPSWWNRRRGWDSHKAHPLYVWGERVTSDDAYKQLPFLFFLFLSNCKNSFGLCLLFIQLNFTLTYKKCKLKLLLFIHKT